MEAGMRREERWACQMESDHGGPDVEGVGQQRVSSRHPQPTYQTRHCITQEEQGGARGAVESNTRGNVRARDGVECRKGDEERAWEQKGWGEAQTQKRNASQESFILSHTNQNMGPRLDVTPSPGGRGVVNHLRTRRRDVDEGATSVKGATVCGSTSGTPGRVGEMLYGEGEETVASKVGKERPEEKEAHGVTPSEVQGSKFKASTERQDSRTQGTVGLTLHGEEGDVGGEWGVHEAVVAKTWVKGPDIRVA